MCDMVQSAIGKNKTQLLEFAGISVFVTLSLRKLTVTETRGCITSKLPPATQTALMTKTSPFSGTFYPLPGVAGTTWPRALRAV